MRKWIVVAAVLAVLGVGGFYAMKMLSPPPADLDLARSKVTANGLYTVAIEPESEPLQTGTLHTWLVTVTSDGTPVTDAQIAVDGGMPQHGHGLPTAPKATSHIGEGRYRIEGVRFNMGGWWVLKPHGGFASRERRRRVQPDPLRNDANSRAHHCGCIASGKLLAGAVFA